MVQKVSIWEQTLHKPYISNSLWISEKICINVAVYNLKSEVNAIYPIFT